MITSTAKKSVRQSTDLGFLSDAKIQEYFRALLRRLPWPAAGPDVAVRTLGVTSSCRGEGVSTVAAQLAITAASLGAHRVLLVDANFAHPALHGVLRLSVGPGLAEALSADRDDSIAIRQTSIDNLAVLTAGKANGQASRLYGSTEVARLVESLQGQFDLVVYDLPACAEDSSAMRLAGLLDGIVLVIEAEHVRWEVARSAKEDLLRSNARLLGVVMNKRPEYLPRWLQQRI